MPASTSTARWVFAVGDARSDLPLFAAVGFSVALNATAQAQAAASVALDAGNLTQVLGHVHGLLGRQVEKDHGSDQAH